MPKYTSFKDLEAWKESHKLTILIYRVTEKFPKSETFGLISQMQRASVSVVSNIAEGFGRKSVKEKIQFYSTARGSLTELESQVLISRDIERISPEDFKALEKKIVITSKLINGLIKSLRKL